MVTLDSPDLSIFLQHTLSSVSFEILEKSKSQTRRPLAAWAPVQRNEKGIPAGVITRKDALARDGTVGIRRLKLSPSLKMKQTLS